MASEDEARRTAREGRAPGLPGLLRAQAAARPEQPWLIFRRGRDWRWRSWGAVAGAVEALAGEVARAAAGAGLAPPARIGFAGLADPDAVALDVALQAAGFAAAPLPAGLDGAALAAALGERGGRALAALAVAAVEAGEGGRDGAAEGARAAEAATAAGGAVLGLPSPGLAARRRPGTGEAAEAPPTVPDRDPGPVVILDADGRARELAQAALLAATERLGPRIAGPPAGGRDVVLSALPLDRPAGRLVFAWALAAGAALVLESEPGAAAAAAVWARPTVFAAGAADRRALTDWLAAHDRPHTAIRRRPRLPLRRLHTVVSAGPFAAEEEAFWSARGVAALPLVEPVV